MRRGKMFLGLGLAAVILFARGLAAAQRPNVLFISDDQRWTASA